MANYRISRGGNFGSGSTHARPARGKRYVIASQNRVGRIIRAVRREFIVKGQLIRTRDVLLRAYPRLRRFTAWHYLAARRALRKEAMIVVRCRFGRGRSCWWTRLDACWD